MAVEEVFSAVVDSLETLFPTFTSFLKNAVRAGKKKLMALLGYKFDIARVRKTREVLIATFKATQTKTNIFMKTNKAAIVEGMDLARDKIDDYIKDKRPHPKTPDGKKSMLAWLFDNPIMKFLMRFNPFSILIEAAQGAIAEEFGDEFRIPDFSPLVKIFSETIPKALEAQLANAMRLIDSLMIRLQGFVANPKSILDQISSFLADSFWTIFDAISNLITMFWEVATGVFQQAFELISGVWRIPYVTSIFEYTTGQEYSFLNVTSFVGAALLNMLVGDKNRLPFDVHSRPDEFINNIQDKDLDIRSVFEEAFKKISKPTNPHPATINMSAMSAFSMVAMNTSSNVSKVGAPSQGKPKQSTGISRNEMSRANPTLSRVQKQGRVAIRSSTRKFSMLTTAPNNGLLQVSEFFECSQLWLKSQSPSQKRCHAWLEVPSLPSGALEWEVFVVSLFHWDAYSIWSFGNVPWMPVKT
ncbi:uncharacterized protein LY89DRAFT_132544 [Mollisia scopiformis]|uniref:Uncharacterized protein n=1 Tax=Mollisia scopiformis TaxID=149040 RepID=A0A194X302_MOLSC|nr:uncharacterized protein LY89DRAFT_132544 [Mollisia scopiformis]KUJ14212.1 hypothetical protein LY89DRAFT_132544 [Mollisia scopiformis]